MSRVVGAGQCSQNVVLPVRCLHHRYVSMLVRVAVCSRLHACCATYMHGDVRAHSSGLWPPSFSCVLVRLAVDSVCCPWLWAVPRGTAFSGDAVACSVVRFSNHRAWSRRISARTLLGGAPLPGRCMRSVRARASWLTAPTAVGAVSLSSRCD